METKEKNLNLNEPEEELDEEDQLNVESQFDMFFNQKNQAPSQSQDKFYQPPYVCLERQQYEDYQTIFKYFPFLRECNLERDISNFRYGKFFIIRSKKIDDIHKAVKYGIWTSSKFNNIKFNKEFSNTNGEVYFLFTCLQSNFFIGLAKMTYKNEQDVEFAYWGEIGKWRGLMMVTWVYLTDVGFNMITDIKQDEKGQQECIFDLKDGQEVTQENALKMIKHF